MVEPIPNAEYARQQAVLELKRAEQTDGGPADRRIAKAQVWATLALSFGEVRDLRPVSESVLGFSLERLPR